MDHDIESLPTVTDLQQVRIERITNNYQPDIPEITYATERCIVPVKHAGMIIRAVVTEPTGTSEHLEKPAIIIKHGFMASRPAYSEFARHLAASGNRVVHYGMPRSSKLGRQYHPKNLINPLRIHSQALNGISHMLHERYPDSPKKHRLIGHSMGGLAVSKFIAYRPDAVDSAILLGSAGLAEHSFSQMVQRAVQAVGSEIVPFVRDSSWETKAELGKHSLWHIARNPLFLLREGYQAATGNALPLVNHARQSGVKVGAIWMAEDTFFPLHEIDESVQSHFDQASITAGNHLSPQEFPKQSAKEALIMFDRLKQNPETTVITGTIA